MPGRRDDLSLRDHGHPPAGEPTGSPTWKRADPVVNCPNCGGELCLVEVPMDNPLLRGGKGIGRYMGCPACPYASECMVTALPGGGA